MVYNVLDTKTEGGERMSLQAIKEVKSAEDSASAVRAETAASCKRLIAEAHTRGKAVLESELAQAAGKERDILQVAEAKAETEADELLMKARDDAAALEKNAAEKVGKAAVFIMERIVNAL